MDKGVLEKGVEDQKAIILLGEHVVHHIGLLLRLFLIVGADRLERDNLVAAGEDLHQLGHDPLDHIRDIGGDDRAAVGDLIPIGLAHVAIEQFGPLGTDVGGRAAVGDLPRDNRLEFVR